MTTPAIRTIRDNFPQAEITILVKPWVADVFTASPDIDKVILFQKDGAHQGFQGLWQLARELRACRFDLAILLQNAFEAALLVRLAQIPVRAGYNRDARGLLLTHPVKLGRTDPGTHQVTYYQDLLRELGLTCSPTELHLSLPKPVLRWAKQFLARLGGKPVVGLNPGAAYGPAKCWPAEKYGQLAARLHARFSAEILVFGTPKDAQAAAVIKNAAPEHVTDLTGRTKLAEAMALIASCQAFITNDSGLMHVGAALKTPLVAIFGSTDPVATGPYSQNAVVVQKDLPCRPCLKTHCQTDFACMEEIGVDEVYEATARLLTSL